MVCRQQDATVSPAKGWHPPCRVLCWKVDTLSKREIAGNFYLIVSCFVQMVLKMLRLETMFFFSFFKSVTKAALAFSVNRTNGYYRTKSVVVRKDVNPPVRR